VGHRSIVRKQMQKEIQVATGLATLATLTLMMQGTYKHGTFQKKT